MAPKPHGLQVLLESTSVMDASGKLWYQGRRCMRPLALALRLGDDKMLRQQRQLVRHSQPIKFRQTYYDFPRENLKKLWQD
jgi:hypothetical protein